MEEFLRFMSDADTQYVVSVSSLILLFTVWVLTFILLINRSDKWVCVHQTMFAAPSSKEGSV